MKKAIVLCIVLVAAALLGADSLNIRRIGYYDTECSTRDIAIIGEKAYVSDAHCGVVILDIADPSNPLHINSFDTPGETYSVSRMDSLLYIADGPGGIRIVNISRPESLYLVDVDSLYSSYTDIVTRGSFGFSTLGWTGFVSVDYSEPSDPEYYSPIGGFGGYAYSLFMEDDYIYIASGDAGLKIIDIADPSAPSVVGEFELEFGSARSVFVRNDTAYIAAFDEGLKVVDCRDKESPYLISSLNTAGYASGIWVEDTLIFLADYANGLRVINFANPYFPVETGYYSTIYNALGVTVHNGVIYTGFSNDGLYIFDNGIIQNNPAEIDTLWFWEETFCNDSNIVNICYELVNDTANTVFEVFNGGDWLEPVSTMGSFGHLGENISPGVHCFQWHLNADIPDSEATDWIGRIAIQGESQSIHMVVPGTCCPFFAGAPEGTFITDWWGTDSVPGNAPVGIDISADIDSIVISASGSVSFGDTYAWYGPDGSGSTNSLPVYETIGGISMFEAAPITGLMGVFLGTIPPNSDSIPARLTSQTQYPEIQQAFYIGAGPFTVYPPEGSTRLYFAVSDSFRWEDNRGAYSVNIDLFSDYYSNTFQHIAPLDSQRPSLDLTCPSQPVLAGSTWTFDWISNDLFIKRDQTQISFRGETISDDYFPGGDSYEWNVPYGTEGPCTLEVTVHDSFCNVTSERCVFEIETECSTWIDSVWMYQETDCDNRNIVEICYNLSSTCPDSSFTVEARMSADSGATWSVNFDSLIGVEGHIGDEIYPGTHCFQWEIGHDMPDTFGTEWMVEIGFYDDYDTFLIVDSIDIAFNPQYGRGLAYGDGYYWIYDYNSGYVFKAPCLGCPAVDTFDIGAGYNCDIDYEANYIYYGREGGDCQNVWRVNTLTGAQENIANLPEYASDIEGVQVIDDYLYVAWLGITGMFSEPSMMLRLDLTDPFPIAEWDTILTGDNDDCHPIEGMTYAMGFLWGCNDSGRIVQIDPTIPDYVGCYPVPNIDEGAEGMCWDGEYMWYHNYHDSGTEQIYKIALTEVLSFSSTAMGTFDTRAPEVTIDCPDSVMVSESHEYIWHIHDNFSVEYPCSVYLSGCGYYEHYEVAGSTFTWTAPWECSDFQVVVAAKDSFCNWGYDTCHYEIIGPDVPCSVWIDSVWFTEETECDDSNIVTICYDLRSTCPDSTYNISAQMSADSGATWGVPLITLLNDDSDLGDGVSPGVHCFDWVMSEDMPDTDGCEWVVEISIVEFLDTFMVIDSVDNYYSASSTYGGLAYGDGYYWLYDPSSYVVYKSHCIDIVHECEPIDTIDIPSNFNCDIDYQDEYIYYAKPNGSPDRLYRISVNTGIEETITNSISPSIQGVHQKDGNLFVTMDDRSNQRILKFDLALPFPISSWDTLLTGPRDECHSTEGLTYALGCLWSSNNYNRILQIDLESQEYIGCYTMYPEINGAEGLCWDGEYLWYQNNVLDKIYKISIFDDSLLIRETASGCLDSRPPTITLSCPESPLEVGDTAIWSWTIDDLFPVEDYFEIHMNWCANETSFVLDSAAYQWIIPPEAAGCDVQFTVAGRDSFCNWGYDSCTVSVDTLSIECQILIYCNIGDTAIYSKDRFEDLATVLESMGNIVTLRGADDGVVLDDDYLSNFAQVWFIDSKRTLDTSITLEERDALVDFAENGRGLAILAEHAPYYTTDANYICAPWQVDFNGTYNHRGADICNDELIFAPHQVSSGLSELATFVSESKITNSGDTPFRTICTLESDTLQAALQPGDGRVFLDVSFSRFLNTYIADCDDEVLAQNISCWLEPGGCGCPECNHEIYVSTPQICADDDYEICLDVCEGYTAALSAGCGEFTEDIYGYFHTDTCLVMSSHCESESIYLSLIDSAYSVAGDTDFVEILPDPEFTIRGDRYVCPGDIARICIDPDYYYIYYNGVEYDSCISIGPLYEDTSLSVTVVDTGSAACEAETTIEISVMDDEDIDTAMCVGDTLTLCCFIFDSSEYITGTGYSTEITVEENGEILTYSMEDSCCFDYIPMTPGSSIICMDCYEPTHGCEYSICYHITICCVPVGSLVVNRPDTSVCQWNVGFDQIEDSCYICCPEYDSLMWQVISFEGFTVDTAMDSSSISIALIESDSVEICATVFSRCVDPLVCDFTVCTTLVCPGENCCDLEIDGYEEVICSGEPFDICACFTGDSCPNIDTIGVEWSWQDILVSDQACVEIYPESTGYLDLHLAYLPEYGDSCIYNESVYLEVIPQPDDLWPEDTVLCYGSNLILPLPFAHYGDFDEFYPDSIIAIKEYYGTSETDTLGKFELGDYCNVTIPIADEGWPAFRVLYDIYLGDCVWSAKETCDIYVCDIPHVAIVYDSMICPSENIVEICVDGSYPSISWSNGASDSCTSINLEPIQTACGGVNSFYPETVWVEVCNDCDGIVCCSSDTAVIKPYYSFWIELDPPGIHPGDSVNVIPHIDPPPATALDSFIDYYFCVNDSLIDWGTVRYPSGIDGEVPTYDMTKICAVFDFAHIGGRCPLMACDSIFPAETLLTVVKQPCSGNEFGYIQVDSNIRFGICEYNFPVFEDSVEICVSDSEFTASNVYIFSHWENPSGDTLSGESCFKYEISSFNDTLLAIYDVLTMCDDIVDALDEEIYIEIELEAEDSVFSLENTMEPTYIQLDNCGTAPLDIQVRWLDSENISDLICPDIELTNSALPGFNQLAVRGRITEIGVPTDYDIITSEFSRIYSSGFDYLPGSEDARLYIGIVSPEAYHPCYPSSVPFEYMLKLQLLWTVYLP